MEVTCNYTLFFPRSFQKVKVVKVKIVKGRRITGEIKMAMVSCKMKKGMSMTLTNISAPFEAFISVLFNDHHVVIVITFPEGFFYCIQ